MTFKTAQNIIDKLPAGSERGEFSKVLQLLNEALEFASLQDEVRMRQTLSSLALVATELASIGEIETLSANVKKRGSLPRGFGLWSSKMQLGWLRQNQAAPVTVDGKSYVEGC